MTSKLCVRRGFLKALSAVVLGALTLTAVASPAEAARHRVRRGGYARYYRAPRYYGGAGMYRGGYGYGYRYGYGGVGPRVYSRGYYGPVTPVRPFYGGYGYYPPVY